jgi:hypothetical protein
MTETYTYKFVCSECGQKADVETDQRWASHADVAPEGWSMETVTGLVERALCPACATPARVEEFWCEGKRDALVAVTVMDYGPKGAVVTAEDSHLTLAQFKRALRENFPGVEFRTEHPRGYWRATA